MMTKSDEYRNKIEDYDLLQAAVPQKDRLGAQWELTLRGGGPRLVAIGHMFSGIECEVDNAPPVPILVRKPKIHKPSSVSDVGAGATSSTREKESA